MFPLASLLRQGARAAASDARRCAGDFLVASNALPITLPNFSHSGCIARSVDAHGISLARRLSTATGQAASGRPDLLSKGRQTQKRNRDLGLYLVTLVVGMVGATYLSVPLYRMFCQATGFGGTVRVGQTVEEKLRARRENPDAVVEAAAAAQLLTVSFAASVVDGMPWKFEPTQRSVKVRPGQSTLAFFRASNTSDRAVTGVSTYNVTPNQAGYYFNKIQCFCFEEQKLRPGEEVDMPVFFYIDPEFATDPKMKTIDHITLSYTFFKVSEDGEDEQE
ncbi:unnamed protein product [Ostreobium quekettii]|uniref:Cytochrome c oxidase assembly protein CtaG/Cox11 n=1 Tax=Ostreobium quekettii TaxID=121088 RepID=A0A8S1IU47_9CHLO|nr:unnamed protein product [Ostreobium quekettii]|eukprot:evm.model.scf_934EXC.3 EVM.evm.TU.scf_934EXC.3   scf_934EXC:16794-18453(-)